MSLLSSILNCLGGSPGTGGSSGSGGGVCQKPTLTTKTGILQSIDMLVSHWCEWLYNLTQLKLKAAVTVIQLTVLDCCIVLCSIFTVVENILHPGYWIMLFIPVNFVL